MTLPQSYTERSHGHVADGWDAVGIVPSEDVANPEWVTCVQPKRVWEWAELLAYCWSNASYQSVEVGLVADPNDPGHYPPMLVAGDPTAERMVAVAPRQDTRFVPGVIR